MEHATFLSSLLAVLLIHDHDQATRPNLTVFKHPLSLDARVPLPDELAEGAAWYPARHGGHAFPHWCAEWQHRERHPGLFQGSVCRIGAMQKGT